MPRARGTGLRYGSLYTKRKERAKKKARAPKRIVLPTLSDWIGKGALKPPEGKLEAPSFSKLKKSFPDRLPDGRSYSRKTPEPSHLERLETPEDHPRHARWLEKDADRKRAGSLKWPHWHRDGGVDYLHLQKAWGVAKDRRWSWMKKHKRRWWTVGDGAQRMVRHKDRWWWKTDDGWFLLQGGEPWVWRHFAEWRRRGYLNPKTGARIVYSADGRRVAVIVPGKSLVFDAVTGKLLDTFLDRPG